MIGNKWFDRQKSSPKLADLQSFWRNSDSRCWLAQNLLLSQWMANDENVVCDKGMSFNGLIVAAMWKFRTSLLRPCGRAGRSLSNLRILKVQVPTRLSTACVIYCKLILSCKQLGFANFVIDLDSTINIYLSPHSSQHLSQCN